VTGEKPFLNTAEIMPDNIVKQTTSSELYLQIQQQFQDNLDISAKPDATLYLDLSDIPGISNVLKAMHDDFLASCFGANNLATKSNRVFEMYDCGENYQIGKLKDSNIPGTFVSINTTYNDELLVTIAFSDGKYSTPDKEFLVRQYYTDSEGNITVKED